MSVQQPQTTSLVFAILTLFAATAWGQQKGADIPVYESDNAIFGSDSISGDDLFLKTALEEEIDRPSIIVSEQETASASDKSQPVSIKRQDKIDSLFGASNKSMVNKDGYFVPTGSGEIWKDVVAESPPAPVARIAKLEPSKAKEGHQLETTMGPILEIPGTAEAQASPVDLNATGPSKLRLRIGFDTLAFQRSQAENTIFATAADGRDWAFSDFDFSEGDARYFVQFMGDDQSGLELTFYDFKAFTSTIRAVGDGVVPFFFQAVPARTSQSYDLNYSSRLKNVELNSWMRHNALQRSGYGVRHINLDETFDVLGGEGLFSRTNNDLWGLTRMWERRKPLLNRITLTAGADAGLYLNRVKIDIDTDNVDDSSNGKNIAGTLGFNLGMEYLIADHVTLRLGYEGLGLFGVGTASNQSLEQSALNGLDDPQLSSLYYGGFYIGAIAAF